MRDDSNYFLTFLLNVSDLLKRAVNSPHKRIEVLNGLREYAFDERFNKLWCAIIYSFERHVAILQNVELPVKMEVGVAVEDNRIQCRSFVNEFLELA